MSKKIEIMDGNQAAAYVSYAFTEVAGIYPITPSSPMAEHVDEWAANGKKNLFGQPVHVVEMQSEGGASGTVHGSLQSGALTTTYTASQGLLLMIPNMYKIAGEMLPGVFHVSARTLSAHALSIFGDHSDVMAVRNTGFAMLASSSPQEVMDLGAVAHLTAIDQRMAFLHFFDGFRTSHEIQKIEALDYEDLRPLVNMDSLKAFRKHALNPEHPATRGTTVNPDIFFQCREACNTKVAAIPDAVEHYMNEIGKITGRPHKLFDYYGAEDAERVIILMGSGAETASEAVDFLLSKGEKIGMINVHLYRPFSPKHFFQALPKSVKKIAVLDRTKEPGAMGEPLYQDICSIFKEIGSDIPIVGGRYGLSSKDTTPGQIVSVFENLKQDKPKNNFTIGIVDDVTHTSLPRVEEPKLSTEGLTSAVFWGMGSDGTVGANKNSIKIIGHATDLYCQAYFVYDSKKSGGLTQSHLRFGKNPIRSPYLVTAADFVACHNPSYVHQYDMVAGLKEGGTFLLNCQWSADELDAQLPASMKRALYEKKAKLYIINAIDIARGLGLGNRTNMIMQSAFFKLADIIPIQDAVKYLKDSIAVTYGKKGDDVVAMNCAAVDQGITGLHEVAVPASWADAVDAPAAETREVPDYIRNFLEPVNRMEGDNIPVSGLLPVQDGAYPTGTSAYEKRGVAIRVPHWDAEKCIQCNQCSFVCPHGCIRPILTTPEETAAAPEGYVTKPANGAKEYQFRITISPNDCTGCGNCVNVCPAKEKALDMRLLEQEQDEAARWDYVAALPEKKNPFNKLTVKGSQFEKPLFEFSGACAGCGETPYIKLVTQLFGDRMMIANSAGCAHVFSGSVPSAPYCKNEKGRGPAWNSSLFEDTGEFGLGMFLGTRQVQKEMASLAKKILELHASSELDAALTDWLDNQMVSEGTRERADRVIAALEPVKESSELLTELYENKDYLPKRSQWLIGGDGWSYDIGYGGLDHALAAGENINVLVLDTEVYSNTGGQASKATPTAAIAKFAASGKRTKKKDLGRIFMTYGYIYVAQVCIGADKAQTLKALAEAEAYPGPSIVIAYCPCINHGIKTGMGLSQMEAKHAVDCGYWALYRYNPQLVGTGVNPFTLDSKEPTMSFREFLMNEVRYASLLKAFPDEAEGLLEKTEKDAMERLAYYKKLAAEKE